MEWWHSLSCSSALRDLCRPSRKICLQQASRATRRLQAHRQRWDEGVGYLERETFDAFLQLPAPQRKLIREVILTFAKVHGDPEDASVLGTSAEHGVPLPKK